MASYWVPDTALPARMTMLVTTFLSNLVILQVFNQRVLHDFIYYSISRVTSRRSNYRIIVCVCVCVSMSFTILTGKPCWPQRGNCYVIVNMVASAMCPV